MKLMRDDLHSLTGSYALDALGKPERASFERHLPHCASCQAEVRGLRETAAQLALARALRPPSRMRAWVLAGTDRTRQLPPPAARRRRTGAAALALGVLQAVTRRQRLRRVPVSRG